MVVGALQSLHMMDEPELRTRDVTFWCHDIGIDALVEVGDGMWYIKSVARERI